MNILYDHGAFCSHKYGGVARYFHEIISSIVVLPDVNVSLFQGFYTNKFDFSQIKGDCQKYFGFKRRAIPKTKRFFEFINRQLFLSFIKKISYDVYHATYYSEHLCKVKKRSKTVITVFDMIHELFPSEFTNIKKFLRSKKRSILEADAIIAISENTKNDLVRIYDIDKNRIIVTYMASADVFSRYISNKKEANDTSVNQQCTLDRPYILYVGNRKNEYKNFGVLIEAYANGKLHQEVDLLCFGGGEFSKEEVDTFRKYRVTNHIHYRSGHDIVLAQVYHNAKFFIYPSLYEGFGIPITEAMSVGCPVITTNSSSIPEVADDAVLYFDNNSSDSLIDKMRLLLFSSTEAERLKALGYQQAKKFSWNKTVQETLAIYKKLC